MPGGPATRLTCSRRRPPDFRLGDPEPAPRVVGRQLKRTRQPPLRSTKKRPTSIDEAPSAAQSTNMCCRFGGSPRATTDSDSSRASACAITAAPSSCSEAVRALATKLAPGRTRPGFVADLSREVRGVRDCTGVGGSCAAGKKRVPRVFGNCSAPSASTGSSRPLALWLAVRCGFIRVLLATEYATALS
jgi:hypothetical protein